MSRTTAWLATSLVLGGALSGSPDEPARVSPDPAAVAPGPEAAELERGESYLVGGWWFQYLGETGTGERLWLFPHTDGVFEVFRASGERPEWQGSLESVFSPREGSFSRLFNAGEVLNELLDFPRRRERSRNAARLLRLFIALHGGSGVPYYLEPWMDGIDGLLEPADLDWVKAQRSLHEEALARVESPGTRVPGLSTSLPEANAREHYRLLVADGYLDVAVIGGNLENRKLAEYFSWSTTEQLRGALHGSGERRFRRFGYRAADDPVLSTSRARLLDADVRVRITATGGSLRGDRIRRAVANFVEGFAHADIVIYHGHSNRGSGAYYLSESKSRFSRFQIGMGEEEDLARKLHALKEKPYQIIALQSCDSYDRYCRPIYRYLEDELAHRPGRVGLVGLGDKGYFVDFVPRYSEFLEMLIEGRGPRDMLERLNSIRPSGDTPPVIFRGVLQPRFTFIVPEGVEIEAVRELDGERFYLTAGEGSDGRTYYSTEAFPQDAPGDVVQVVDVASGIYGLYADGRIFGAGRGTRGSALECRLTKRTGIRFAQISKVRAGGRSPLLLISTGGGIYTAPHGRARPRRLYPGQTAGLRFVAAGRDANGRLVVRDEDGRSYALERRGLRLLEKAVSTESAPPSLLGRGVEGTLWMP